MQSVSEELPATDETVGLSPSKQSMKLLTTSRSGEVVVTHWTAKVTDLEIAILHILTDSSNLGSSSRVSEYSRVWHTVMYACSD